MNRHEQITNWLQSWQPEAPAALVVAAADASIRQYWRASWADHTVIVMDFDSAQFDVQPFLARQAQLAGAGVAVPQVLAQDAAQGLVALEDLGDVTLASLLTEENAKAWYLRAIHDLVQMQAHTLDEGLPPFDAAFIQRELDICREWYFGQQFKTELAGKELAIWERACALITAEVLQQPTVFMHRDFHSRNLMVKDAALRVIDFQDAVKGPIAYDLVSLLRDAYVTWNEAFVLDLVIRYWEMARDAGLPVHEDFSDFYRAFEWAGVQRHIKILGIFARLNFRDGKDQYLADQPRVFEYVRQICLRYRELTPLGRLLLNLHGTPVETGFSF
ncbi:phosphotransferase [Chitinibacter bivalviorum]|uniref:Phosphotransferase n=1 Tax=Chitinibacter bivalviorum TaxID=2739434 RepID=A0A7H9BJU7_9NEIS|nr:phosphotransferase [Chitinibacter bivalviorum]QLG88586.1 phosphotransferase [Chitinibacter bivalviorum]